MSLAVLEINDVALTIKSDTGEFYAEPGFARLGANGIDTGEPARATAWTEPQSNFNQYWQQLGENPLPVKSRWARHFADIAFAQLKRLFENVGEVDECVLAIPGNFNNQQLSLLLGMLNAQSVKTLAVIDSALAARLHQGTPAVYVDVQLHQGVASVVDLAGNELAVTNRKTFPELGLARLYKLLARGIANRLIDTSRFDPLHDPVREQWVYDQLPQWLLQLQWQRELNLVMDTPAGERPFRLSRDNVADPIGERLVSLNGFLREYPEHAVALSSSGAMLAGLGRVFENVRAVDQALVPNNCLSCLVPRISPNAPLKRITALPVDSGRADAESTPPANLYLLHRHRAFPLTAPVSIRINGDDLFLAGGIDTGAAATIVQRGDRLTLLHKGSGTDILLPASVRAGATLEIQGHKLVLIEVGHD